MQAKLIIWRGRRFRPVAPRLSVAMSLRPKSLVCLAAAAAAVALAGCVTQDEAKKAIDALSESKSAQMPDQLPVMQNTKVPFHYPDALIASGARDSVVLRIFIDSLGAVRPESTRLEHPSRYPALDTAALVGARDLVFTPARRQGHPMAVSIKLPVQFNPPPPLPKP
jgi:periplasmic protein TonB